MTYEITTDRKGNEIITLRCCSWLERAQTQGMSKWLVTCGKCKAEYLLEKRRNVMTGRDEWRVR